MKIAYEVAWRASVARGLADSEAGRTTLHEAVLREFGLDRASAKIIKNHFVTAKRLAV